MEAFEHIVKVYLESQGYIVTTNVKFPVRIRTKKAKYPEYQTHGYEVDIVGAKSNSLLLGSVKSFFGSSGVNRQGFKGIADASKKTYFDRYKIFNEPEIRKAIVEDVKKKYGYSSGQIQFCLFVGKFNKSDEDSIIQYLNEVQVKVYDLKTVMRHLIEASKSNTYIDDPVIVTLKALRQVGFLLEG
ncbi:MAG: hypothetical protein COX14_00945 [Chloroflexi bacterium CG23_combo_of_CG06-09_8_20_14_all_45_10]|nr:MAG: hypothetical protein COX14_00945 [Chloroflexi bacterium CG23_combo_of_CG06-09_8_20_14_all_45_10]